MRWLLTILVILVSYGDMCAQFVSRLTTSDGLSSNRICSVVQDGDGFVWMLTRGGIDQLCGLDIIHHPLPLPCRPYGIDSYHRLVTDNSGCVWEVGAEDGHSIYYYDKTAGTFAEKVLDCKGISGIRLLAHDDTDRIWMASGNKILYYNVSLDKTVVLQSPFKATVNCGTQLSKEVFAIGGNEGLFTFKLSSADKWTAKKVHVSKDNTEGKAIYKIIADPRTTQYYVFDNKSNCFCIDGKTSVARRIDASLISDSPITDVQILPSNNDKALLSTIRNGIVEFSFSTKTFRHYMSDVITAKTISAMMYDQTADLLWYAEYPHGISLYNESFPLPSLTANIPGNQQSLMPGTVTSICEDSDGDIWYTTTQGVSRHSLSDGKWTHYLTDSSYVFLSSCPLTNGKVIVGGLYTGAYIIDKHSGNVSDVNSLTPDGECIGRLIRSMCKDHNGNVWIGGAKGLYRYCPTDNSLKVYGKYSGIITIREYDKTHIWVVMPDKVALLDVNSAIGKYITLPAECNTISSILTSRRGDTYIGTVVSGLFVKQHGTDTFVQYKADNSSLLSSSILAMTEDTEGNVVMSTTKGLSRYYPASKTFFSWNPSQGMSRCTFYDNSVLLTSRRILCFGGNAGSVEFADSIRLPRNRESRIVITRFAVNGQSRIMPTDADHITLDSDEGNISITVSSLSYYNPYEYLYTWDIDGVKGNQSPTPDRTVRYSLSPGTYRLTIKSYNSHDYSLADQHHITIVVRYPWWWTWQARCAYIALIIILLLYGHKMIRQMKLQKKTGEEIDLYMQLSGIAQTDDSHRLNNDNDSQSDAKFMAIVSKEVFSRLGDTDFTVDTLCGIVCMSRTSFYTRLKGITGYTPSDFIRKCRLERAKQLLATTDHSVTEIAEQCGFSDAKYFRTVFHKHIGTSPTEYRKTHNSDS